MASITLLILLAFSGPPILSQGLEEVHENLIFEGGGSFSSTYVRSGTGSQSNPYIVSDLDMGPYNIQVKNTTVHLILRNITFSSSTSWALFLYNADNIVIENVTTVDRSRVIYGNLLNDLIITESNFSRIKYTSSSFEFINCNFLTIQDSKFSEDTVTGAGRIYYNDQGTGHRFQRNQCIGVAYEDLRFHGNGLIDNSTFLDSQVTVQNGNTGSRIVDNIFRNSGGDALWIKTSYRLIISNNHFQAVGDGIYFDTITWQTDATPQVIENNSFESCNVGINTGNTYETRVTYTHIKYNYFGNCTSYAIVLNNGLMNKIWRNIFYHNAGTDNSTGGAQATQLYYYVYYENKWTVGSTGNFWANHRQPDADNDGIVDVNYTIPSNGLDTRPSTNPYFDITRPVVTITAPGSGIYPRSYARVTWTSSDTGSGISRVMLSQDGAPFVEVTEKTHHSLFLEEGNHRIKLKTYDLAELYGEDVVELSVPDTEDVLDLDNPANGGYNSTDTHQIRWTVRPYFIPVSLSLDIDGSITFLSTNSRIITRIFSEGVHTIRVTVRDDDGLEFSKALIFTVDLTPPQIVLRTPESDSTLSNNYVTFNFSAKDNYGIDRVEFRIDEGPYIDRTWTTQFSDLLPDGPHIMNIRAYDLAGSITNLSIPINIGGDTGIDILEPLDGAATRGAAVMFRWDHTGDFPWKHSFYRIGKGVLEDLGGAKAVEISLPADGEYVLSVRLVDDYGNYIETSTTVIRDTKPPLVDFLNPEDGSIINDQELEVVWVGREQFDQEVQRYELSIDDGPFEDLGRSTSRNLSLISGSHRLTIKATDPAGNTVEKEISFIIDTEPPIVDLISPKDGDFLMDSTVLVTWKASDLNQLNNLTLVIDHYIFIDVLGRSSYSTTIGVDGRHNISLIASDLAGNLVNITIEVIVDLFPPILKWVNEPVGSMGRNWFNISWTAIDRYGIANLSLELDDDVIFLDPRSTSVNLTLEEGEHVFTLRARDLVGWEWFISNSESFIVDLTSPTLKIDLARSSVSKDRAIIYWTAEDNGSGIASTLIDIDGEGYGPVVTGNGYTFENLVEGEHRITLKVIDLAGNSHEEEWSFVVDAGTGPSDEDGIGSIPTLGIIGSVAVGLLLVVMVLGIIISRKRSKQHEKMAIKAPHRPKMGISPPPVTGSLPTRQAPSTNLPPASAQKVETTEEGSGYIRPKTGKKARKRRSDIEEGVISDTAAADVPPEPMIVPEVVREAPSPVDEEVVDPNVEAVFNGEDAPVPEWSGEDHEEGRELSNEVPLWDEDEEDIAEWDENEIDGTGPETEEVPEWDDIDELEELEELDEVEDQED